MPTRCSTRPCPPDVMSLNDYDFHQTAVDTRAEAPTPIFGSQRPVHNNVEMQRHSRHGDDSDGTSEPVMNPPLVVSIARIHSMWSASDWVLASDTTGIKNETGIGLLHTLSVRRKSPSPQINAFPWK